MQSIRNSHTNFSLTEVTDCFSVQTEPHTAVTLSKSRTGARDSSISCRYLIFNTPRFFSLLITVVLFSFSLFFCRPPLKKRLTAPHRRKNLSSPDIDKELECVFFGASSSPFGRESLPRHTVAERSVTHGQNRQLEDRGTPLPGSDLLRHSIFVADFPEDCRAGMSTQKSAHAGVPA